MCRITQRRTKQKTAIVHFERIEGALTLHENMRADDAISTLQQQLGFSMRPMFNFEANGKRGLFF
jgi:hypothetical protein